MVCVRNSLGFGMLTLPSCSDPAVKQLLVNMNEKEGFIIQDLDDNHLLIKADAEERIRRELEAEVCSNLPLH